MTRALCRSVLSQYANIEPASWLFEFNKWGKPSIALEKELPWLEFNLSNTRGMVACLVHCGAPVGVDVEFLGRRGETVALADRYFSPVETRDLHSLLPSRQRQRFFEYWTLKEAYVKARGTGLALTLRKFSFRIGRDAIRVAFDTELEDDPADWQFGLFRPTSEHILAVGVRRGGGPQLSIDLRRSPASG